jgi:hypothetical protein
MKKLITICAVAAMILVLSSMTQATMIQGSTAWNIFGNITTVNNHTFIMPQPTIPPSLSGMFAQTGFEDFSVVPCVPFTNMTWLSSNTLDVANPVGWTFGSTAFGTWVTTGGTHTHYSGGINVSLQGTFTPGTMFGGLTQSQGLMSIGFIMNGNTASNVSGSMAMVPEPATICILGFGALSLIRRKK